MNTRNFFRLASLFLFLAATLQINAQNVGVDVASPQQKLDVLGGIRIGNTTVGLAGSIRWTGTQFEGHDGSVWAPLGGTATSWSLTGNSATNPATNFLGTTDNVDFRIRTNNTERLNILAGGNIGIGTASPSEKLDVWGNIDLSAVQPVLKFSATGTPRTSNITTTFSPTSTTAQTMRFNLSDNTSTGTTEIIRLQGDGNVGIGATSPQNKLDVEGAVAIGATYSGTNIAPANGAIIQGNVGIGTSAPTQKVDIVGGDLIVRKTATGTSSVITIAGSRTGGNTPYNTINTTAPARLDFQNNDFADANTDYIAGRIESVNRPGINDGELRFYTSQNLVLQEAMNINNVGNVGIGTIASDKLHVVGSIRMVDGNQTAGYIPVSDANGKMTWTNPATITTAYVDEIRDADNDTKIQVEESADEDIIRFDAAGTQLYSMRKTVGGSPWLEVNSSNTLIGSTISTGINGSGAYNTVVGFQAAQNLTTGQKNAYYGDNAGGSNITGSNNTMIGTVAGQFNNGGSNNTIIGGYAGRNNLTGSGNVFLGFAAGENEIGSSKLYIDNSSTASPLIYGDFNANILTVNGNVGIGTTAPGAKLDVTGTNAGTNSLQLRSGNTGSGNSSKQIIFGYNGAESYRHAIQTRHNSGADANNAIDFYVWDFGTDAVGDVGTKRVLTIDGNGVTGSVGIGTETPTEELHVVGSIRMVDGNQGANKVMVSDANGTGTWTNATSLSITETDPQVSSTTTNYVPKWNGTTLVDGALFDNGNVGIGTTSPGEKLHVKDGVIRISHSSASPSVYFQDDADNSFMSVNYQRSSDRLEIRAQDNEPYFMMRNTNGYVGIGVSSGSNPSERLHVVGSIRMVDGSQAVGYIPVSDANGKMTWTNPSTVVGAQAWKLTGNSGTVSGTNFIGTTDNVPVDIKSNSSSSTSYVRITNKGQVYEMGTGRSVFLGESAGNNDDLSNNDNAFIGYEAGLSNTTGQANAAVGYRALRLNTTGVNNTAMGYDAMGANTTGHSNLGLGFWALTANTTGFANAAVGLNALKANTTGNGNTAIGALAGYDNITPANSNTTGSNNTFIGYNSGYINSTQRNNATAIGYNAKVNADNAMVLGGTGGDAVNVGIGTSVPAQTLDVNGKIQMRTGATTGYLPVSDANGTMTWTDPATITTSYVDEIRDADNDTKIQVEESADEDKIRFDMAGTEYFVMTNGRLNVVNTGGSTFLGLDAGLADDLSNNFNTFAGYFSGKANTTGSDNVAYGAGSLENNVSGSNNTAIGRLAMLNRTSGGSNTALGQQALYGNISGSNNTAVGTAAGQNNTGSGNVFIGYAAGYNAAGSDKLYIDNSTTASPLIYGDFSTDEVTVNGELGIGIISPDYDVDVYKTEVNVNQRIYSNDVLGIGHLLTGANGGGHINLIANSSNTTYLGVPVGVSGVVTDYTDMVFATGTGGTATEQMRITTTGSVGIGTGTSAPGAPFHVNVNNTSTQVLVTPSSTTGQDAAVTIRGARNGSSSSNQAQLKFENYDLDLTASNTMGTIVGKVSNATTNIGDLVFNNSSDGSTLSETMRLTSGGMVGIGSINPTQAKLVVNGSQNSNPGAYGYLNNSAPTGTNAGGTNSYSIYASARIAATEFNAYSDIRIKNITGISNSSSDLKTIMGIEITDYTFIDEVEKGKGNQKKVIAQQVEKVYPQAVSTITDVVPDIYKISEINSGRITIANNLKVGEKVKLIFENRTEVIEVSAADENGFNVNLPDNGKVFVFGREVSDFRTVDYEALSTLNISATQELVKMINQLQSENSEMKNKFSSLSSDVEMLKAMLNVGTKAEK